MESCKALVIEAERDKAAATKAFECGLVRVFKLVVVFDLLFDESQRFVVVASLEHALCDVLDEDYL